MMNGSTEDNSYRYTPDLAARIEAKWQKHWADNGTFNAPNPTGDLAEPGAALPVPND